MTNTPSLEKALTFKTPAGRAKILQAYQVVLDCWPVPYEEIEVETHFGATHVVASGPMGAPPLILVHAFYATAMVWRSNVAALSRDHRVFAVDCIGEPNRSVPSHPISSRLEYAEWLSAVMDGLEIGQADMVGNSNGGFQTLNQALHAPDRIKKAVLISPAATFVQMWPFYVNFFVPVVLGSRPLINRAMHWWKQGLPVDEDWERLFLACLLDGLSQNRVFPAVFTDKELRQIRTPTLLLIGDREVIYQPRVAIERAIRLMPTLRAELIQSANHIAGVSQPGWVNRRILKYLWE